ncbi:SDR family oxidoreductase [Nonomuraea sp. NPDC003709]|uniref:NAD(P)-dependent oxidoreductase n=1 Tax=Nonomuraea sp. NPDC003709 TaxID=3154450 RepID=UPI0033A03411
MRLLLFGATPGTSGAHVLSQAVEAGHDVTVVARTPEAVPHRDVVRGDVLHPETWRAEVAGHDAVLSCLGTRDRRHPATVYSQGAAHIIDAMSEHGVRRLVCLSSAGLEIPPGTSLPQRLVIKYVIQRLYRHPYADMARMEALVHQSDLDWTIVRPPMLTDGPLTGTYRHSVDGHLSGARSVSRADLAHYLLHHLDDPSCLRRTVEISS